MYLFFFKSTSRDIGTLCFRLQKCGLLGANENGVLSRMQILRLDRGTSRECNLILSSMIYLLASSI